MTKRNAGVALTAALFLTLAVGCGKKKLPPPPPPPPPPVAEVKKPVISFFNAEPSSVEKGQPVSLRWSVTDSTDVRIDQNVGQVSPNGRRSVYPTETTTYTLTAAGQGGSETGTVTVTISQPPAPPPPAAAKSSPAERIANEMKDLHFDYDRAEIRADDQSVLQSDATTLKSIFGDDPNFVVTIEGHCDERGSAEYNVGLGDRRAAAVRDALVQLGVPTEKLKTVSYGKERPLCTDASEDCYQRNRRAHFAPGQ